MSRSSKHSRGIQRENWLLDPDVYWDRAGSIGWRDLAQLSVTHGPLWVNDDSTYNGLNDRVSFAIATSLTSSLTLIHVERLEVHVFAPGQAFGNSKRRGQGRFSFGGTNYWLWITDPRYERAFLAQPNGTYALGECYLTISLAEPYKDECYKVIAAVIERTNLGGPQ